MVRPRTAFSNCATYLCAKLSICIYQPYCATQDTNTCETTLAVAPHNSPHTVFTFTCTSYCIRQFLERVRENRDSRHNFRLHLLGFIALDCAHISKFFFRFILTSGDSYAHVCGPYHGDLLPERVLDSVSLLLNW
jgi:hypothetical protein